MLVQQRLRFGGLSSSSLSLLLSLLQPRPIHRTHSAQAAITATSTAAATTPNAAVAVRAPRAFGSLSSGLGGNALLLLRTLASSASSASPTTSPPLPPSTQQPTQPASSLASTPGASPSSSSPSASSPSSPSTSPASVAAGPLPPPPTVSATVLATPAAALAAAAAAAAKSVVANLPGTATPPSSDPTLLRPRAANSAMGSASAQPSQLVDAAIGTAGTSGAPLPSIAAATAGLASSGASIGSVASVGGAPAHANSSVGHAAAANTLMPGTSSSSSSLSSSSSSSGIPQMHNYLSFAVPRSEILLSRNHLPNDAFMFHFDTHRLVQSLRRQGFTEQQAEAVMVALSDISASSVNYILRNAMLKSEQDQFLVRYQGDLATLRKEMQILEKSEFAILRNEADKQKANMDKITEQLKEEIAKLKAGVRLDFSLEKSRIREDTTAQEHKIKDTNNRLDTEVCYAA
ncbi:hypothetical protein, variant [Capsaspora owczarzaki ATCC 30864]|uniref:Uncharacterized protein n=1 Tax=Capsaspora owczarzaki (strain ATCC 30864) TaxID=595528 RepID=A0A0D2X4C2_CAPO3|nr:hypothetical protein, variant [Capsaspora owczarzaki ATCC 30864]